MCTAGDIDFGEKIFHDATISVRPGFVCRAYAAGQPALGGLSL
jgi:hypothetical protein